jgi:metal-sulfur cluster biosynthetic enzyme
MCNNGLARFIISSRKKMSELKEQIVSEIKKIYDPEIPVNIYELGLIYKIEIKEAKKVNIDMTLTSPNCPVAESLPKMVKDNILKLAEVDDVDLNLGLGSSMELKIKCQKQLN